MTILSADDYLNSVVARDIRAVRLRWLWQGRIPLGAITILDGDPGLGKSLLTIDLAARVTTGLSMPDGSPGIAGGGGVVLLSGEDHPAATIRPRLEMAAANLDRVEIITSVTTYDSDTGLPFERDLLIPQDIPLLEDTVQRRAARLVVIDPLMTYLASGVNSWRDQDVRRALAPLAALAERTGAAVLILRHLNKATGMSAIQRGGGSIGIIGAARAGLLVAKSPDDPDHERVLASSKSNLGPPMPSLRYRLVAPLQENEGLEEEGLEYLRNVPVVDWQGECSLSATALLAASAAAEAGTEAAPTKTGAAEAFLRAALADGPRPAKDVLREALSLGMSKTTVDRVSRALPVQKQRLGSRGEGGWLWRLPDPQETPTDMAAADDADADADADDADADATSPVHLP